MCVAPFLKDRARPPRVRGITAGAGTCGLRAVCLEGLRRQAAGLLLPCRTVALRLSSTICISLPRCRFASLPLCRSVPLLPRRQLAAGSLLLCLAASLPLCRARRALHRQRSTTTLPLPLCLFPGSFSSLPRCYFSVLTFSCAPPLP